MEFISRASRRPGSLAIFSAAFNPPTVAHVALVEAALERVDEVLIALPRIFPHKSYEGLEFAVRREMARLAFGGHPRCSTAVVDQGLFIDIAQECCKEYPGSKLFVLVGRDAAERIAAWDYGDTDCFENHLEVFELLVAGRDGRFEPSESMATRIHHVELSEELNRISSTEVRRRIRTGDEWRHLVPDACIPLIERAISSFSA